MTLINSFRTKTCALAILIASTSGAAQMAAADDTFDAEEKEAIGQLVREYLLENPELIREVIDKFNEEQEARIVAESSQAIEDNWDILANDPSSFVAGNPDGKFTVIEFFDYNCGFCRGATPSLLKALETNEDLRVVFREFPIRGQASEDIARLAMASVNQGRYMDFHTKLMAAEGQLTVERALEFADELDINTKKLKKDAKNEQYDAVIAQNMVLAEMLYIDGTPSFIIGNEVIRGWPGATKFNAMVASSDGEDVAEEASN